MEAIIETFKKVVTQIATPFSTGTGFYWKDAEVVVTNEHVVRGNREVVVEGHLIKRQMARVIYTDPRYDLAFLTCSAEPAIPAISIQAPETVKLGDQVLAAGHPFGLKFSVARGVISSTDNRDGQVKYYQHDAVLSPGHNGGPLVSLDGGLLGVNSFTVSGEGQTGQSLPAFYLKSTVQELREKGQGGVGSRCFNCSNLVFEETIDGPFCPHCGSKIRLPSQEEEYEAVGIHLTIEEILVACGYNIKLSRRGPCLWEVEQGSAKIFVTYYEPNGLIAGDAILCELPREDIMPVYEYLLRANNELEGLTLSVKGKEIVLSLIIFDRFLSSESGLEMFNRLFQKADELDNVLVEQYGCSWKE